MSETMDKKSQIDAAWEQHLRHKAEALPFLGDPSLIDCRTPDLRNRLAGEQNWRCCYCQRSMAMSCEDCGGNRGVIATFEHVIPVVLGGMNIVDNLVVACHDCNTKRGHSYRPEHSSVLAKMPGYVSPRKRPKA